MSKLRIAAAILLAGPLLSTAWAQDVLPTAIQIAPSTIVLDCNAMWVTVHTDLPYAAVDPTTVQLDGIDMAWAKADACGRFVAKFVFEDVAAALAPAAPGCAELTLTGLLADGTPFAGSDTVWVK
ncbi:MAG: hypothetical protein AB7Y46_14995 [Armatimonadota bacterium]